MLTGESIPVMKTPIPNNKVSFNTADESKQFTLYAGTFCMESRTK